MMTLKEPSTMGIGKSMGLHMDIGTLRDIGRRMG